MIQTIILPDPRSVAEKAARLWAAWADESMAEGGRFVTALSGGSTPLQLYQMLASEPYRSRLPWEKTAVFFCDERRVSHDHPDSNYRMARESLLDHVPIPAENIFPFQGEGLGKDVEKEARWALEDFFGLGRKDWPRFDLMLLGLGSDGHFASIFPGTRAVSDLSNRVLVYEVPTLKTERITFTLPVFNNARHLLFLVTGEKKAEAVMQTLTGPERISAFPAKALKPANGDLTFLLDEAAASLLPEELKGSV